MGISPRLESTEIASSAISRHESPALVRNCCNRGYMFTMLHRNSWLQDNVLRPGLKAYRKISLHRPGALGKARARKSSLLLEDTRQKLLFVTLLRRLHTLYVLCECTCTYIYICIIVNCICIQCLDHVLRLLHMHTYIHTYTCVCMYVCVCVMDVYSLGYRICMHMLMVACSNLCC